MEKRTPQDVLKFAKDKGARVLDLKFIDFPGTWQHFSLPISALEASSFEDGFGFDGSSIRGFQAHQRERHAARCRTPPPPSSIRSPKSRRSRWSATSTTRSPRNPTPATRASIALQGRGVPARPPASRPTIFFGPEAEFFIFDDVRFDQNAHAGVLLPRFVERASGTAGRDEQPEPGLQAPPQGGLLPGPAGGLAAGHPHRDHAGAHRAAASTVEAQHHEVATAGQCGDRPPLRHAGADGRPAAGVQVRGQERGAAATARRRRSCPSRCSATTDRACTATSRCGRATQPLFARHGYAGLSRDGAVTTSAAS